MALDLKKLSKNFEDALITITDEEIEKYFTDKRPKGWLSIEQYLPTMFAKDVAQGYSVFKVRDKDGNEFESKVADHNVWYYEAKEMGISHWLND